MSSISGFPETQQIVKFVPRMLWYGEQDKQRVMVLELLGPSLEDLLGICNPGLAKDDRRLSMPTVLVIGIRIIQALELMHRQGYVHRDIKPENLLMGNNSTSADVCESHLSGLTLSVPRV
jgi:serine/threonine protein kinase